MKTIISVSFFVIASLISKAETFPLVTSIHSSVTAVSGQTIAFLRVHRMADDASVNWGITNPLQAAYFIVERSEDGSSFQSIHEMPATGAASYRYRDVTAIPGYTYYRVLCINQDGSVTESETVELRIVKRK